MAQIIASILAEHRETAQRLAARAAMAGADWIELRLDRWPLDADVSALLAGIRLPVLVAIRTPDDGGHFRGSPTERRGLFGKALAAGAVGIDLEHWENWTPSVGRDRLRLMVRSYHNLGGMPKDLGAVHDRLFDAQGTVAKLAVTAHDLADAAPVLDLLGATDQRMRPTVAFAMGRAAWPTRVLACALGAPFVYAAAQPGFETALGQPPVDLLAGLYRAHAVSGSTTLFGLVGNPALASLGPWLHNRAFRRLGVDALYLPFETSRPEAVLSMLPRNRVRGISVTAPHKPALAAQCHRLGAEASAVGAVNTLTFEAHGLLVGHNTDVAGVLGALRRAGTDQVPPKSARAAVLGTGGAARAAAFALTRLGYQVTMLGRSLEPVRAFAQHHGMQLGGLQAKVLDELKPAAVVHATPVGSLGRDPDERLLPEWRPKPGTVVLDMVYQPHRTRLLADVEAAGGIPVPGLEMFLTQAAAQLELFAGATLAETELRAFLAGAVTGGP